MFNQILSYIAISMDDKQIGKQIKKARTDKGLSQELLGEKLGVTWEMVSRYENGRSSARKYLAELSQVLDKPIAYFFGVEEDVIEYNIEKIASALKEKGVGYNKSSQNKITLIDNFSILGFEKSLKLTRQYYSAPDWVTEKYHDVFALRLGSLSNEPGVLEVNSGDIGFFSPSTVPTNGDILLVQKGNSFKLSKYSASLKDEALAVLIIQEKRFR
jgi:transcriptional regulator with XRE-family HTH domain